jgi:hypothetical protein
VAFCGVMCLAFPECAQAQIRPVYTKNVDEKGRIPYQVAELVLTSACSTNGLLFFCERQLPAVPAGKRLVIERLTMFLALASGSPDLVRFVNPVTNGTLSYVQPSFTQRVISAAHFFLNQEVLAFYEPGQTPAVRVQATGQPVSIEITVQGYLIDAVN